MRFWLSILKGAPSLPSASEALRFKSIAFEPGARALLQPIRLQALGLLA